MTRIRPILASLNRHFILLAAAPASLAWGICPLPATIAPPSPGAAASLTAERANVEGEIATAIGAARLEYGGQALEAPRLRYDRATQEAFAPQGLRYVREGLGLTAASARVDIDDGTGRFTDARFSLSRSGGRGSAATVVSLGAGQYLLTDADYTTCPLPDPAWQLQAETIELDRRSGRGEAFDTVLRLGGIPILYTPYLNFPIDDKRHTGFLTPILGHSSDDGFELAAPYYLNLAPDLDATITPRLLTDRGLQIGGQLRYLNRHSVGLASAEFLPSDNSYGDDRSLVHFEHRGRLSAHFGVQAYYTKVSDDEYFDDLSTLVARTSQSQLERLLRFTAVAPGLRFSALVQNYQTLEEEAGTLFTTEPYARLPQAQLSLLSPTGALKAGVDAEAVNFESDEDVDARRYDLRPRLLWSRDAPGWFVEGELAWRATRYELTEGARSTLERDIPSLSLDAGLRLQRVLANGWIQTLEPRAFYLYNGYEDQTALPLFDTGVPDLHFGRLFAHNRFVGSDRVGDANQITLALTSRFLEPRTGRTVVKLALGRIYGFRELKVNLPLRSPIGFGDRHSDVVATAEYRPAANWYTGVTIQADPGDDQVNRAGWRGGYRSRTGRRLELGYRFFRGVRPIPGAGAADLEQTHVLASLPIGERLEVVGRWNYSLEQDQSVETLAGIEYRPSCCWAVRAAWSRTVRDDDGSYDTAILLQFELTGLGRFGDDIDSLLERDIVSGPADYYDLVFR